MHTDKIEDVMSELLGEGYRIVWENGSLSPAIDVRYNDICSFLARWVTALYVDTFGTSLPNPHR